MVQYVNPDKLFRHESWTATHEPWTTLDPWTTQEPWTTQNYKPTKSDLDKLAEAL